ncbi:hypothetical protein QVD17_03212 [Tagetes erecta]|uniref:Uncharacterized protein n=1 Tax=Tagetes erecta TaxID=13708 RepID=A0AAD8LDX1_TARER|nr:hypothetical protein QVD17_03212 [Tagetes erecta]
MKPYLMCYFLLISIFLYEAQGINRKLMKNTTPSSSTTRIYDNEPKTGRMLTDHERVERQETVPNVIDIMVMDYTPAKRRPPIHN